MKIPVQNLLHFFFLRQGICCCAFKAVVDLHKQLHRDRKLHQISAENLPACRPKMCRKKRERSAERLSQTCSGVGRIRIAVPVGFRQDLPVERLIVRLTFLHAPRRKTAAFSFFIQCTKAL